MKRVVLIVTLSLVMCLFMAFPASAATSIENTKKHKIAMEKFKTEMLSKYPDGYDYVLFFSFSAKHGFDQPGMSSNSSIQFIVSNTPYISFGSNQYYYGYLFESHENAYNWDLDNGSKAILSSLTVGDFYVQTKGSGSSYINNFRICGIFTQESTAYLSDFDFFNSALLEKGVDIDWRLTPVVDISALLSLLAQAKAKQNTGYTQSSWNALQSQIIAAENLLATTGYTQSQIDNMVAALQAALNGLTLLPNTSGLESLLAQAEAIEDIGYTPETWSRLVNAIAAARALLASGNYTQAQYNAVYNELLAAMNGLTLKVVTPPKPPPAPLGYDLSTGDVSGYLNVVPAIFYNYILSVKDTAFLIFGIILGILIIPRVLKVIIPALRR